MRVNVTKDLNLIGSESYANSIFLFVYVVITCSSIYTLMYCKCSNFLQKVYGNKADFAGLLRTTKITSCKH